MHLSELQNKEIVNMANGKKIGEIIDVIVNTEGNIKSLIIEERRNRRFNKDTYEVFWEQIVKIGDDIILIDDKKKL